MTVSTEEFIRRFLIHTLPAGFQRIRHFGFLANRFRQPKLAPCRKLLPKPADCRALPRIPCDLIHRTIHHATKK